MTRFAARTVVTEDQSRLDIRQAVTRYGATAFATYEDSERAAISFEMRNRRIRLTLALKDFSAQERRSRWRALLLAIKAKLESIESGIETFDEAWMPHIVLPEGDTLGERFVPQIGAALAGKPLPPLLGAPPIAREG